MDLRIWSPNEIAGTETVPLAIKIVMEWVSFYIAKPHLELGRTGAICPFVPPALKLNALWLAVVSDPMPSQTEMCRILDELLKVYQILEPRTGDAKEFKTLIMIFPDIPSPRAYSLVEKVHKVMKPKIVEAGMMLGEFYPQSESPGLHNREFRPLRSPFPLFVYRQMVPNDLVFLTKVSDPPQRRIEFVLSYLRSLSGRLPAERLREAEIALAVAQRQARPE